MQYYEMEQPPGMPLVETVDMEIVDQSRRRTYESYERFLRNLLEAEDEKRPAQWKRDYTSPEAYEASVSLQRKQLQNMLGFWIPPKERPPFQKLDEVLIGIFPEFTAKRFFFEILPGLETYAVELIPEAPNGCGLLVQHGYAGTPEGVIGLTQGSNSEDYSYRSLGIRAARRGYRVLAVHHPYGYGTREETCGTYPGLEQLGMTYGKNRLNRLANMAEGKYLFGLDMMGSSRGIDYLCSCTDRVGMYGLSQGGQSTLYLSAMDTRISASICSAYFNDRACKLIGPNRALTYLDSTEEDKFFPELFSRFHDSDIASLICPRAFAVEAGLQDQSVDFERVVQEFSGTVRHWEQLHVPERCRLIAHREGHISATAMAFTFLGRFLLEGLGKNC